MSKARTIHVLLGCPFCCGEGEMRPGFVHYLCQRCESFLTRHEIKSRHRCGKCRAPRSELVMVEHGGT